MDSTYEKICGRNEGGIEKMITDRELARYISSNLHLYLADEDKPVECKVVDVSKNNGGTCCRSSDPNARGRSWTSHFHGNHKRAS